MNSHQRRLDVRARDRLTGSVVMLEDLSVGLLVGPAPRTWVGDVYVDQGPPSDGTHPVHSRYPLRRLRVIQQPPETKR
jgi:hypothetical protein